MTMKNFMRVSVVLLSLVVSSVRADDWISMGTGGAFPNGYAGSFIITSTKVIRGSVICKQGFGLASTGALFYDADGPVYGKVEFTGSGGALILGSDLRLGTTTLLRASVADTYLTVTGGSSSSSSTSNRIILGGDTRLTFTLRIHDNSLVIDGRGHTLELGAPIRLESTLNGSTWPTYLTLQNMRLLIKNPGLSGSSVTPFEVSAVAANNCKITLQDVDVCLQPDKTVQWPSTCELHFKNRVRLLGQGGTFKASYLSSGCKTLTIDASSSLYVGPGVTFSVWGDQVVNTGKLAFSGLSSALWLDGCTVDVGSVGTTNTPGLKLGTTGCLYFDNKVTLSSTTAGSVDTSSSRGVMISASAVDVHVRGGAYVKAIGPISTY